MEDLDAYAEGLTRAAGRTYIILGVLRAAPACGSDGELLELNPPRGAPLGLAPGDRLVAFRGPPPPASRGATALESQLGAGPQRAPVDDEGR